MSGPKISDVCVVCRKRKGVSELKGMCRKCWRSSNP